MSDGPYRDQSVPEYLRDPRWHETILCRVVGHSWRELFDTDGEPFPAYCERCLRTRPEGRSVDAYYNALESWKRFLDRMTGRA